MSGGTLYAHDRMSRVMENVADALIDSEHPLGAELATRVLLIGMKLDTVDLILSGDVGSLLLDDAMVDLQVSLEVGLLDQGVRTYLREISSKLTQGSTNREEKARI